MTTAQLIFVTLSAILGGVLSAAGWRFVQKVVARPRPLRLAKKRTRSTEVPAPPPKPQSAEPAPEVEQILRAIARVQSTVTDLARVQLDMIKSGDGGDDNALELTVARMEKALKSLPGVLKRDLAPDAEFDDTRLKRLEQRLDRIIKSHHREHLDVTDPRLKKIEAGLDAIFARVSAPQPGGLEKSDLDAAVEKPLVALASKLDGAVGAIEARVGAANHDLLAGLTEFMSRPNEQLDRIETGLERLQTQDAPAENAALLEPAKAAALNIYRNSQKADVVPAATAVVAEDVSASVGGASDAEPSASELAEALSQSEQRLLRTHPGLASILLNKQRIRRSAG